MTDKPKLKNYVLVQLLPEKQKFRVITMVEAYWLEGAYCLMQDQLGAIEFDRLMNDPNVKLYYETSLDAYKDFISAKS